VLSQRLLRKEGRKERQGVGSRTPRRGGDGPRKKENVIKKKMKKGVKKKKKVPRGGL
jgi:hypothetical protein